jgi:6-phosphofructokinase 2
MPPDFPEDIFERIATIAKTKNARLIVDTSGDALRLALEQGVYMLKPSLGEMRLLTKALGISDKSIPEAAKEMISLGFAELVFISKGADGALLVSRDNIYEMGSPVLSKFGTVGAGDSLLAGFIFGLIKGYNLHSAAAFGVACGAASTLSQGTALFRREDAMRLYSVVKNESLVLANVMRI